MSVRTFLAICRLDLLHLVEPDFHRGLTTEDGYKDLQLRGVLVDLRDLAREVGQRAGDDLHRLADRELGARAWPLGGLAVEEPVDLGLRQGDGLLLGADEPGHPRRPL